MAKTWEEKMAGIDADLEEAMNLPMSARVDILHNVMMGGVYHRPRTMHFDALPRTVQDKIALLKMLNNYEAIPDVGEKRNQYIYYLKISQNLWKVFSYEAVSVS